VNYAQNIRSVLIFVMFFGRMWWWWRLWYVL